jgi:hypothetical protein
MHMLSASSVGKHRDMLIKSLGLHLVPALVRHGFEPAPEVKRTPTDRESDLAFPLDRLIRVRGEGVDMLEIQFAPHRRPAFRLNVGIAPKDGMMTATGHWPAEKVCVHWLNEFYEMYAYSRWRKWFSLPFLMIRRAVPADYEKLALTVSALLPEIELALRERKLGPHMRGVSIRRQAPQYPA